MENKELITKAIKYIQGNPKDNLSLDSIASNAGFSLTYFDALFQKHTGYSPVEYSRVYKLTRCALELRRTEKTVLNIALEFGYQSPESFSRAFKSFYGLSPSDYRDKYSDKAVTGHDLSSKISLSRFGKEFPELKPVDREIALDFLFTHDPVKYGEDLVGLTVAETAVFTLDDSRDPNSFIYVSDYNDAEPIIDLVCVDEASAVRYLELLSKNDNFKFTIHVDCGTIWESFDAAAAKAGLTCKISYDMLYRGEAPEFADLEFIRELNADDLPSIRQFMERGGCSECHVRAIQISFERKGNIGLRPVGLFEDGAIAALAMPTLDVIRDFRKYDIGAIFILDKTDTERKANEIWRYAIGMCLGDNARIGSAGAKDDDSPLGVKACETAGLVKVSECRRYGKQ